MARCKCRICGKVLDTSMAFRVEGKPPKYFCSENEWKTEEERKKKAAEDKDKAYTLICRIIGRETIINTALWAEWKEWSKVADDAKIGQFLAENEEYLTGVIGRLADAEFPRIRYLSTVLKNRLGDYKSKVQENVKVQPKTEMHFELFEPALNVQAERVILEDVEDDLI